MKTLGPTGDWRPEELEEAGSEVLRVVAKYVGELEHTPVLPDIGAAELRALLDDPLPQQPERFPDIVADTERRVLPHLTLWNHPRFFAYFPVGSSGVGAMADLLASALNINAMLWKTAPAAAALEQVVLRWMAEMVGYDTDADGVLINGASLATFYALAAAREAAGLDVRQQGMTGRDLPRLRVYASEHAHSSIDKAVIALGVGLDNLVKVETGPDHRVDPADLERLVRADLERGYRPLAVVAVTGTTSTGAVDPVDDIAEVCRKYDMWLHVDGAYGGFYNIVPSVRERVEALRGRLAGADSIVVNPHKVLFTPLEVTALYSRRKGVLKRTFSLVPEYLRTYDPDEVVDPMDFSLQLGRNFRSLKVWWVIRAFGLSGLRSRMEHQLELAAWLRQQMEAHPDFETLDQMTAVARSAQAAQAAQAPAVASAEASALASAQGATAPAFTPYPLVCFRAFPRVWREAVNDGNAAVSPSGAYGISREDLARAVDRLNEALLQRVNARRDHFISHTVVREGYLLRAAIGNIRVEHRHVESLWRLIQESLAELPQELEHWL